MDLTIQSSRVVTPDGVRPAAIHISDGRIVQVTGMQGPQRDAVDAGDLVVMPGIVDTHVHVNEPGRTEWEGFETATRAAAAGGVTSLVDMPLNCIPVTTTEDALDTKLAAAKDKLHVDVGFWGGVIPGNEGELAKLAKAGV